MSGKHNNAYTECEVDLPRDLRAMAASSQPGCNVETLKDAASEIERLRECMAEIADRLEATYGSLPNDRFPGPPTSFVALIRNQINPA